jgi:hypothetical protein
MQPVSRHYRYGTAQNSNITINVPAVYMAQDVRILMRVRSITRAIVHIETFLGPEMATSEASAVMYFIGRC